MFLRIYSYKCTCIRIYYTKYYILNRGKEKTASMPTMHLCLEELLREHKISRYELAKRTGVTYQTIDSYYKNKVLRYDTEVLLKICLALDCEIGELIRIARDT